MKGAIYEFQFDKNKQDWLNITKNRDSMEDYVNKYPELVLRVYDNFYHHPKSKGEEELHKELGKIFAERYKDDPRYEEKIFFMGPNIGLNIPRKNKSNLVSEIEKFEEMLSDMFKHQSSAIEERKYFYGDSYDKKIRKYTKF